jgi:FixJ family two-component response regulator
LPGTRGSAKRNGAGRLVLDLRMPGTVLLILTAHDDETRSGTSKAGAAALLEKPFQSAALVDAGRRVISSQ